MRIRGFFCGLIAVLPLFLAFSPTSHGVTQPLFNSPPLNQVFQTATHNSYWVERRPYEAFASGVRERILDQMLFDGARSIEIDIHKSPKRAWDWDVYHTRKTTNSLCKTLRDCLRELRLFHYALPQHEVVTVMFELKEILGNNFDSKHTPEDLDAILEQELGPLLYRPKDFLSRCGSMTMRECAVLMGWPTVEELRGKIIFTVLGNWFWKFFGKGGKGWAEYATYGSGVAERSAFPMVSDWDTGEKIPADIKKAATDASVFVQAEEYSNPAYLAHLQELLRQNLLIRMDNAFSIAQQEDQVKHGFQYLQTDYPWIKYRDGGFAQPFRAFDGRVVEEPGIRNFVAANTRVNVGKASGLIHTETLITSTIPSPVAGFENPHAPRGKGCLEVSDSASGDYFRICRETVSGKPSYSKKKQIAETVVNVVEWSVGGVPSSQSFTEKLGAGDLVKIQTLVNSQGQTCAAAFASQDPAVLPKQLSVQCFAHGFSEINLVAEKGDVLFVGL